MDKREDPWGPDWSGELSEKKIMERVWPNSNGSCERVFPLELLLVRAVCRWEACETQCEPLNGCICLMLETGNYGNRVSDWSLQSTKEGEHSGEVIFSVVEFTYGVECIELQIENCGLFFTVLDKDKITEHYGVLRTRYITGIVNTNGQNVGT